MVSNARGSKPVDTRTYNTRWIPGRKEIDARASGSSTAPDNGARIAPLRRSTCPVLTTVCIGCRSCFLAHALTFTAQDVQNDSGKGRLGGTRVRLFRSDSPMN